MGRMLDLMMSEYTNIYSFMFTSNYSAGFLDKLHTTQQYNVKQLEEWAFIYFNSTRL